MSPTAPTTATPESARFDLIYADPPWRYGFSRSASRAIENQYPTMTHEDICALEVPASDNAVLYLWAVAPKLPEALEVMAAWGFTYKSCSIWDKQRLGMGYWWRGQHELLLVGVKGKFSPPAQPLRRSSVFSIKSGRHSEKPAAIRDYIVSAFPHAKRLEMFARVASPGWAVWGNEVEPTVDVPGAGEFVPLVTSDGAEQLDLFG
ncbi:MT-A70 family methyltransferase [uncultured Friedmanniella sp.]|uniref:MT-A70 family methyltransferase n=1 Tax=uncultured Friedmanniella sp. TaxID=335381 RepID=UPI0035C97822